MAINPVSPPLSLYPLCTGYFGQELRRTAYDDILHRVMGNTSPYTKVEIPGVEVFENNDYSILKCMSPTVSLKSRTLFKFYS